MSRSSARLTQGINTIFTRRRLDDEALEELEELLISSDMGIGVAGEVAEALRKTRFNQEVSPEEVRAALAEEVIRLVEPVMKPLRLDLTKRPFVILVVGVNGSGKTTTIAKLAKQYRDAGHEVMLAAGDTFRAAAVEQLQIWGERTGCPVVTRPEGSDSAGLAFDALVEARTGGSDILLIDTAGRLHNKADLMGELQKIVRVLKKVDPQAPHSVLLVLDATTGQNAHAQAEIFREMVGVTGIVMTKLDGTARGGVLVSLAEKYGIPIHAIGVGETAAEVLATLRDLRENDVDIVTIGQYLQPSNRQLKVERYVSPKEFEEFKAAADELGFRHVESGPLVRSSYHAWSHVA